MSWISFSFFTISLSFFYREAYSALNHEDFHRAIFLGQALPHSFEKSIIKELGLISTLVVSGIHFQWSLGFLKKLKVPGIILLPVSIFLGFLWNWNLPVLRAFLAYQFKNLPFLKNRFQNPFLVQSICFFLCLFQVSSQYQLHSLWLSFAFSFYFENLEQKTFLKKLGSALFIFSITPFLLPFPSKLSLLSIFVQFFFIMYFTLFLFVSPLLHLVSSSLCQQSFDFLFYYFQKSLNLFPFYHPFQSGGMNLCLVYFFLMIFLAHFHSKAQRKKFFSSYS